MNAGTVNPDIVMGKPYYEFEVDREEAARYGMTTMMVNQIVAAGLGGMDVTTTVEGRQRYPIQVRFSRDIRERIDELRRETEQMSRFSIEEPKSPPPATAAAASVPAAVGPEGPPPPPAPRPAVET